MFVGCGTSFTAVTIPIQKQILDKDNARVIVYRKRGFMEDLTVVESLVIMDGKPIGLVGNGKHIDIQVNPGHHILCTKSGSIDLEKTFFFKSGETYFIERWMSTGPIFLYSNLSITEPISEYQTMVYKEKSNAIYKQYADEKEKNYVVEDNTEKLVKISELYEKGYLTKEEFETQKKKLLK